MKCECFKLDDFGQELGLGSEAEAVAVPVAMPNLNESRLAVLNNPKLSM